MYFIPVRFPLGYLRTQDSLDNGEA